MHQLIFPPMLHCNLSTKIEYMLIQVQLTIGLLKILISHAARQKAFDKGKKPKGIHNFLWNLKSVISLFRSAPDLKLGLNNFEESRSRLVDAQGTLTLLIDDISFRRESV